MKPGGWSGTTTYGLIITSYANGIVTGSGNTVGGLLGINNRGAVIGGYAAGRRIRRWRQRWRFGRPELAGRAYMAAYATGNVSGSGSGGDEIGGLVGDNRTRLHPLHAYATGSVSGAGGGADQYWRPGGPQSKTEAWIGKQLLHRQRHRNHRFRICGDRWSGWGKQRRSELTVTRTPKPLACPPAPGGEGKTSAELQTPTDNSGIYEEWRSNGVGLSARPASTRY